ncbi:MAG TPA: PPOX class F420-dependent oxidoreductase [Dehalococcoidia bacterium]|nr:PPOX class F420-dependent oxidoreductase [Dehalococcoidia bacterium]
MVTLTPEQRKLILDKNLAHFVTLMKDGSPQVTPVWVDCDDTHILINTAEGRQKPLNLARDPRVALSVVDADDIYRYIQVRGRVVEVTTEGAFEHISMLGRKYRGDDYVYPQRPGEQRVIIRIEPLHVGGRL